MSKNSIKKNQAKQSRKSYFLQSLSYAGKYDVPTHIEMIRYNQQQVVTKDISPDMKMHDELLNNSVSWFKITGFTDVNRINTICKDFGIHRFDLKDLFSNLQVTKIVTYTDATFIMMSGCFIDKEGHLAIEQIAFILGKNYVISFQETDSPIFDDVISAINETRVQIREKGADYLLYILMNAVYSQYIESISKINDHLDEIEDDIINHYLADNRIMQFFRTKRKEYALIRRSIIPMREEFDNLLHNSNQLIDDDSFVYFNDFDDRLRTTLEELELLNESIMSLMDLYFNNNNLKMNEIIKRLTVVSTIFIPLTFMVGVWGMNFDFMPELRWKYGYFVSWGIMIIIALIAIYFLKKKKWF